MSDLRCALRDYLSIRRALGFELRVDGRLLEDFVGYVERAGAEHLTIDLAVAWARLPEGVHPQRWRQRLGMVRCFARYVITIDPDSEVPPTDLLAGARPRVAPYLYTPAQIAALIEAARELVPPLRAATHATLIGLLAVSGLRIGEALALDRGDVDLHDGTLHVRAAKNRKQREVPLHESTVTALEQYTRLRQEHWPRPHTPAFLLSRTGGRLTASAVYGTFPKLIRRVGLEGHGQRTRPRPHDLRHSFAMRTLLDWHRAGENVDARLPLLSTYLGHTQPASTYWYLQASPELLTLVSERLHGVLGEQP